MLFNSDRCDTRLIRPRNVWALPQGHASIHLGCRFGWFHLIASVLLITSIQNAQCHATGTQPAHAFHTLTDKLVLLHRSITQDQGAWVIDYELSCSNGAGVLLTPGDVSVSVEGWVSNSRVASHAIPRFVRVSLYWKNHGSSYIRCHHLK